MITGDYIGTRGRLFPVEWSSALSESHEPRYTVQSARSKRWAFVSARAGGTAFREWSVSVSGRNASASVLVGFAQGAYGPGPFVWAPVAAHASNLCLPGESLLTGAAGAGMDAVDGWAPRSALGPASVVLASTVPVLPGSPVTGTVDVTGSDAVLELVFRNATGGVVATVSQVAERATVHRLSRVVPAVPAAARTVDLVVRGHVAVSRPQVTWTDSVVPWAVGAGARDVVVTDVSRDLKVIDVASGDSWWDLTAKITEVG